MKQEPTIKNRLSIFFYASLTVILLWLVIYMIFSFGYWEINPAIWDAPARGIAALIAFILFWVVLMYFFDGDSTDSKENPQDTTMESWKEKLDIVQAFSNGQDIEAKAGDGWIQVEKACSFSKPASYYRIGSKV